MKLWKWSLVSVLLVALALTTLAATNSVSHGPSKWGLIPGAAGNINFGCVGCPTMAPTNATDAVFSFDGSLPLAASSAAAGDQIVSANNLIRFKNNGDGKTNYQYIGMLGSNALNLGASAAGYIGFNIDDVLKAYIQRNSGGSGNGKFVFNGGATFATLGTVGNGELQYCTDCLINSAPCTGASTGAFAKGVNGAWRCD